MKQEYQILFLQIVPSQTSKDKYGIYIEISLLSSIDSEGNDLNENEIIRTAYIYWDSSQNKLVTSGNISFSNDGSEEQETEFVLQRDNFFAQLCKRKFYGFTKC